MLIISLITQDYDLPYHYRMVKEDVISRSMKFAGCHHDCWSKIHDQEGNHAPCADCRNDRVFFLVAVTVGNQDLRGGIGALGP